jgi:hypothetical protein
MRGYVVRMTVLPDCQFCAEGNVKRLAKYDAKTKFGPWAYVCESHFNRLCIGIGVGYGQLLIKSSTMVDGEQHTDHDGGDHEKTKPLT